MAAPQTNRLKYYSRDVTQQENEQYIEAVHGITGFYVLEKLRMHIYGCEGGYYCQFNDFHKRLFCQKNGNVAIETLNAIIEDCFLPDVQLFDKSKYEEFGILTSKGLQKRWKKIVVESNRKNNVIIPDYCLIEQEKTSIQEGQLPSTSTQTADLQGNDAGIMGGKVGDNGGLMGDNFPDNSEFLQQTKLNKNKLEESKTNSNNVSGGISGEIPSTDKNGPGKQEAKPKATNVKKVPFVPPTQAECVNYFLSVCAGILHKTLAEKEAKNFFDWYEGNGWVQGKVIQPLVSWKSAANRWITRVSGDEFKIENGKLTAKTPGEAAVPDEKDPVKKLEFAYQKFLNNQLDVRKIDSNLYDYLLQKSLLNFAPGTNARIRQQARQMRAEGLEGTNEASLLRLLAAYQLNTSEAQEPIKSDIPNLNREARKLSIQQYFLMMQESGKKKLFEGVPA